MEGYIEFFFIKYSHTKPMHPQLTLHKHWEMKYGATQKLSTAEGTMPSLNSEGVNIIQAINGTLL